jgi:hypothetical protein
VRYGIPPAGGGSWKELLLKELDGRLDLGRIHLVQHRVPHPVLHELFCVAACHVDLTYPFVLSWSLLVGFFEADGLVERIAAVLADRLAGLA